MQRRSRACAEKVAYREGPDSDEEDGDASESQSSSESPSESEAESSGSDDESLCSEKQSEDGSGSEEESGVDSESDDDEERSFAEFFLSDLAEEVQLKEHGNLLSLLHFKARLGSPSKVVSFLRDCWVLLSNGRLDLVVGEIPADADPVAAALSARLQQQLGDAAFAALSRWSAALEESRSSLPRVFSLRPAALAFLHYLALSMPAPKRAALFPEELPHLPEHLPVDRDGAVTAACVEQVQRLLDAEDGDTRRWMLRNVAGALCTLLLAARSGGAVTDALLKALRKEKSDESRTAERVSVRLGRKLRGDPPNEGEVKVKVVHHRDGGKGPRRVIIVAHLPQDALLTLPEQELRKRLAESASEVASYLATVPGLILTPHRRRGAFSLKLPPEGFSRSYSITNGSSFSASNEVDAAHARWLFVRAAENELPKTAEKLVLTLWGGDEAKEAGKWSRSKRDGSFAQGKHEAAVKAISNRIRRGEKFTLEVQPAKKKKQQQQPQKKKQKK